MFSGHDRVFLAWTWVAGCHSPDGRLRVREDGDCSERGPWLLLPGVPRNRCVLCVVCIFLLAPAHMGLVAFPGGSLLPGDGVASSAVLQSVNMVSLSQSVRRASCLAADSSSIVTVASRDLQKDRFFLSARASDERLQPVSERAILSDEFLCLVPLRGAGELEGEATQTVIQLYYTLHGQHTSTTVHH